MSRSRIKDEGRCVLNNTLNHRLLFDNQRQSCNKVLLRVTPKMKTIDSSDAWDGEDLEGEGVGKGRE